MVYELPEAINILARTPRILRDLLQGLDDVWLNFHKHKTAFSALDVIGHLITGDQTDWIPRMKIMMAHSGSKEFPPFDQVGFDESLSLEARLDLFEQLRVDNLKELNNSVTASDLDNTGIHPRLGEVTLKQHLATWVVHDLNHIFQITESLALRYKQAVGPWIEFLRILKLPNKLGDN